MAELKKGLPPLPPRMAKLPIDERGYPVPWFVAWVEGKPDFRIIGKNKRTQAVKEMRCWLCGEPLGKFVAFVIGPMCAVNRVSSEPPSHLECAEFAVAACPFLANPEAHRIDKDIGPIEESNSVPGIPIARNPGVSLIWVTRSYTILRTSNGDLLQVGDPVRVSWYHRGRPATREEVLHSINTGLPALMQAADDSKAMTHLNRQVDAAMKLVPRLDSVSGDEPSV